MHEQSIKDITKQYIVATVYTQHKATLRQLRMHIKLYTVIILIEQ